jgi:hypothetical protein
MLPARTSFIAYIDESGDTGFRFKKSYGDDGSSEWFVLSAVIVHRDEDPALAQQVKGAVLRYSGQRKRLHFVDLPHEQRVALVNEFAMAPIVITSVIVHKKSLTSSFKKKWSLYFYATRYLIERISWFCRDAYDIFLDLHGGRVQLFFSNASRLPYDDLRSYIGRLKMEPTDIDWDVIDVSEIHTSFDDQRVCLQLADMAASGIATALEYTRFGFTEHRYLKTLKPVIYERDGKYRSYGMKLFPDKLSDETEQESRIEWMKRYFW